jgi:hypothetical protein
MKLSPPLVLRRAGFAWQYTTGGRQTRTEFARSQPGYQHVSLAQDRLSLEGFRAGLPIQPADRRPDGVPTAKTHSPKRENDTADVTTSAVSRSPTRELRVKVQFAMLRAQSADAYPQANQPKGSPHRGERAHPWCGMRLAARVAVSRSQAGVSQLAPVSD